MKRTKFLALALVVAVMLMGAGYAQWTDVLKVENTVTTGDMNVKFIDEFAYEWENPYIDCQIDPSDNAKTETVTITNMYPGSVAVYEAGLQNFGTLPAKIENVVVDIKDGSHMPLANRMRYFAGYTIIDENNHIRDGWATWGTDLGTLQANLNQLFVDRNVVLKPGEKLYFDIPEEFKDEAVEFIPEYAELEDNCFVFNLPCDVVNSEDLEKQKVGFDITVNFGQEYCGNACEYSVNEYGDDREDPNN